MHEPTSLRKPRLGAASTAATHHHLCTAPHDAESVLHWLVGAALHRSPAGTEPSGATVADLLVTSRSVQVLLGDDVFGADRMSILELMAQRHPSTTARLLVPPSCTRSGPVREMLTRLTATRGIRVRTTPARLDVVAVLSSQGPGFLHHGGVTQRIEQPVLRAALGALFEAAWNTVTDLDAVHLPDDSSLPPERRAEVLGHLAGGVKDEAAARLLDVSVRTYRRYVARLLEELGAESRFQAGVRAARAGMVEA